ncbi:serine protease [Zhengella mangrovi]|uniref:Serine protease n=1 Tax=Zhengella mangrovi TaxID=1982044 RepID=A0A2G1QII2_9HYPH|nr:DegQ family serine endoprotease [Zhengella mangrovi]PHP65018.1 serine protease [Zhengella mangrovi]
MARFVSAVLGSLLLLLVTGAGLQAAENGDLRGLLGKLLGEPQQGQAVEQAPATGPQGMAAADSKRVPFGRRDMELSFAPLVKQTAPAVVNVYAKSTVRQPVSPFSGDPFFEQFFGGGGLSKPRVQQSLGSGVIVDASGLVVTNFHVIKGADEVKVALADGREFESQVMLKDESVDLAVLKIKADRPLPYLTFGNSDALEVGDLVLAIGNPFGVGQTTTSGIVSALARSHVGVSDFGFFIQTDAAINPGNSGGALIDMHGQLVGINTAIFTRSGGSNGIGFAIPSIMVRAVVNVAKNGGDYFERPWLGAEFTDVDSQTAEALGMDHPTGALVQNVTPDSPAEKGDLKPGDVLLSMNGRKIETPDALGYRLATESSGTTVKFEVLRRGKVQTVPVTLERAPEGSASNRIQVEGNSPFAGATISDLSPRLAQRLHLPEGKKGVVIIDLARNSPAARFGFRPGDIVVDVNGEVIESASQLNGIAMERSRWWRFAIDRDGQILRQVLRY